MTTWSDSNLIRAAGVLLHPTSIPSDSVCGTFGSHARKWLKLLANNNVAVWQFLPLAPPDATGSPYSSPSSFAINPWFLDSKDLEEEGFLPKNISSDLPCKSKEDQNKLDFDLADLRSKKLASLLLELWPDQSKEMHIAFQDWCSKQFWIEDHVSFMLLREQFDGQPWWEWPSRFSLFNREALEDWRERNSEQLLEKRLVQWHLDRQLNSLRKKAHQLGILLFGDLPFYVARDSSDVWSNRDLFTILPDGELETQSGVPPDYFSETGQLWGTPVYRWKNHQKEKFIWWRRRFARNWEQVDLLRLDHFRALESYWAVPGNSSTAQDGVWKSSPGEDLLNLVKEDCCGTLPLIAEDLGIITSAVESLRDKFGLSGMKVLQFAFDGDINNTHLPQNIVGNKWVVYTGTHDNQTSMSWWQSLDEKFKNDISKRIKNTQSLPPFKLIEIAFSTESKFVIVPLQDLLCLEDHARLNTPGTVGNNWSWRLNSFDSVVLDGLKQYRQMSTSVGCSLISEV